MSFGCGNRCCGFLMRSFLLAGGMTASRGYGSCSDEIIPFPEEDLFKEGKGRLTHLHAQSKRGPKTIIRYPEAESIGDCSKLKK